MTARRLAGGFASVLFLLAIAVLVWTVSQPIENVRVSLIGFLLECAIVALLIPALHIAIDP